VVNPRVETPGVRSAKTPGVSEPSPWLVLALVCLPVFIGALDLTIVSAVLPTVIFELKIPVQTGLDDAAWIVSGYLLAYAVSMINTKQLTRTETSFAIIFWMNVMQLPMSLAGSSLDFPLRITSADIGYFSILVP